MDGIDLAPALLSLAGALATLLGRSPRWSWLLLAAAVAALSVESIYRPAHWQTLPALLAILLTALILWSDPGQRLRLAGCVLATALCLVTYGLNWLLPVFHLPQPTGPYATGTRTVHWIRGSRELVVQLWYPATPGTQRAPYARWRELRPRFAYQAGVTTNSYPDAAFAPNAQPAPILLFGPMWGGRRGQNTALAEDLASHGYLVAAIDHPGNAGRLQLSDGQILKSDRLNSISDGPGSSVEGVRTVWQQELALWVADDRFVLDQLAGHHADWLQGHLDWQRVGAVGHSFGGASSLALLGQDPRVKAAVNLDGWTLGGLANRTNEPFMIVYEQVARERRPPVSVGAQLDALDNAEVDQSLAHFGGARLYVAGVQHADFTDAPLASPWGRVTRTGPIPAAQALTLTRTLVLSFFEQALRGKAPSPDPPGVDRETWRDGKRQ